MEDLGLSYLPKHVLNHDSPGNGKLPYPTSSNSAILYVHLEKFAELGGISDIEAFHKDSHKIGSTQMTRFFETAASIINIWKGDLIKIGSNVMIIAWENDVNVLAGLGCGLELAKHIDEYRSQFPENTTAKAQIALHCGVLSIFHVGLKGYQRFLLVSGPTVLDAQQMAIKHDEPYGSVMLSEVSWDAVHKAISLKIPYEANDPIELSFPIMVVSYLDKLTSDAIPLLFETAFGDKEPITPSVQIITDDFNGALEYVNPHLRHQINRRVLAPFSRSVTHLLIKVQLALPDIKSVQRIAEIILKDCKALNGVFLDARILGENITIKLVWGLEPHIIHHEAKRATMAGLKIKTFLKSHKNAKLFRMVLSSGFTSVSFDQDRPERERRVFLTESHGFAFAVSLLFERGVPDGKLLVCKSTTHQLESSYSIKSVPFPKHLHTGLLSGYPIIWEVIGEVPYTPITKLDLRTRHPVGQATVHETLRTHVREWYEKGTKKSIVISGKPGSGKSALSVATGQEDLVNHPYYLIQSLVRKLMFKIIVRSKKPITKTMGDTIETFLNIINLGSEENVIVLKRMFELNLSGLDKSVDKLSGYHSQVDLLSRVLKAIISDFKVPLVFMLDNAHFQDIKGWNMYIELLAGVPGLLSIVVVDASVNQDDIILKAKVSNFSNAPTVTKIIPLALSEADTLKHIFKFLPRYVNAVDSSITKAVLKAFDGLPISKAVWLQIRQRLLDDDTARKHGVGDHMLADSDGCRFFTVDDLLTWTYLDDPVLNAKAAFKAHSSHYIENLRRDAQVILTIASVIGAPVDSRLFFKIFERVCLECKIRLDGHSIYFTIESLVSYLSRLFKERILIVYPIGTTSYIGFERNSFRDLVNYRVSDHYRTRISQIAISVIEEALKGDGKNMALLPLLSIQFANVEDGSKRRMEILDQLLYHYAQEGSVIKMMAIYNEIQTIPILADPQLDETITSYVARELTVGRLLYSVDQRVPSRKHYLKALKQVQIRIPREESILTRVESFWCLLTLYKFKPTPFLVSEGRVRLILQALAEIGEQAKRNGFTMAACLYQFQAVQLRGPVQEDRSFSAGLLFNTSATLLSKGYHRQSSHLIMEAEHALASTDVSEETMLDFSSLYCMMNRAKVYIQTGKMVEAYELLDYVISLRSEIATNTLLKALTQKLDLAQFLGRYDDEERYAQRMHELSMSQDPCSETAYIALLKLGTVRYDVMDSTYSKAFGYMQETVQIRKSMAETNRTHHPLPYIFNRPDGLRSTCYGYMLAKEPVGMSFVILLLREVILLMERNPRISQHGDATGLIWYSFFDTYFPLTLLHLYLKREPVKMDLIHSKAIQIAATFKQYKSDIFGHKNLKDEIVQLAVLVLRASRASPLLLHRIFHSIWKGQLCLLNGNCQKAIKMWEAILSHKSTTEISIALRAPSMAHLRYKIKSAINIATMIKTHDPKAVSPEIIKEDLPYYSDTTLYTKEKRKDMYWHVQELYYNYLTNGFNL